MTVVWEGMPRPTTSLPAAVPAVPRPVQPQAAGRRGLHRERGEGFRQAPELRTPTLRLDHLQLGAGSQLKRYSAPTTPKDSMFYVFKKPSP
jgi:hypothetical protein